MSQSPFIIPYSFLTVCGAMSRFLSRSNLCLLFPFLPMHLIIEHLSYVFLHFLIEFSAFQNSICGILGYSSFPNNLSVDVGLDRSASLRDLSILFLLASIFARPYCAFLLTQQRAVLAHSCCVYVKRPIGVCPLKNIECGLFTIDSGKQLKQCKVIL